MFGDPEVAERWLLEPSSVLGAAPLTLLQTADGAERVREELVRIEHDIYI